MGFLALLISSPTFAADADWKAPEHGFVISLSTSSGIPQKTGVPATVSGTVSLVGKYGETGGGPSAQTILDVFAADGVELQASFPDRARA